MSVLVNGAFACEGGTVPVGGIIGGIVATAAKTAWRAGASVAVPFTFEVIGAFDGSVKRGVTGAPKASTKTAPHETAAIIRAIGGADLLKVNADGTPDLSGVTVEKVEALPKYRELRSEVSAAARTYEPVFLMVPVAPKVAGIVTLTPDDAVKAAAMEKVAAAAKAAASKAAAPKA